MTGHSQQVTSIRITPHLDHLLIAWCNRSKINNRWWRRRQAKMRLTLSMRHATQETYRKSMRLPIFIQLIHSLECRTTDSIHNHRNLSFLQKRTLTSRLPKNTSAGIRREATREAFLRRISFHKSLLAIQNKWEKVWNRGDVRILWTFLSR